ncbi:hypothetical protein [Litorivivens sp.]|uniref:hypothetical protein n=1 Tax=Litorivivens sp. TaxID=2020868 RepID=UPI0035643C6C
MPELFVWASTGFILLATLALAAAVWQFRRDLEEMGARLDSIAKRRLDRAASAHSLGRQKGQ